MSTSGTSFLNWLISIFSSPTQTSEIGLDCRSGAWHPNTYIHCHLAILTMLLNIILYKTRTLWWHPISPGYPVMWAICTWFLGRVHLFGKNSRQYTQQPWWILISSNITRRVNYWEWERKSLPPGGWVNFSALLSQYRNRVSQSMLRLDRTFTEQFSRGVCLLTLLVRFFFYMSMFTPHLNFYSPDK